MAKMKLVFSAKARQFKTGAHLALDDAGNIIEYTEVIREGISLSSWPDAKVVAEVSELRDVVHNDVLVNRKFWKRWGYKPEAKPAL
ncbi:MAG: hypothetical protein L6Q57_07200 [Alphaproteobacteria bacterium]|nr:hypothetical protein [Alphaproteobacteria bacterium]